MNSFPQCPQCKSKYVYQDQILFVCPEYAYEWSVKDTEQSQLTIRDSVGNVLNDGDDVTVIEDLKIRGSSQTIKVDTKTKGIRLINPEEHDDHDIDCKISGFGPMRLKSDKVGKA